MKFNRFLEVAHLLPVIRSGDRLAYFAYLDHMEENGQVPKILSQWRNIKVSQPDIRWMIRRDMDEILSIEQFGANQPWDDNTILKILRERNCIGMVSEIRGEIRVGHMIYELGEDFLEIRRLTVHPMARKHGIGKQMIDKLKSKLTSHRRTRVVVKDHPVKMSEFFKKNGFIQESPTHCVFTVKPS